MPDSDKWQSNACILCSINCGIKVKTDGDRHFTRIIGDKEHPVSQGYVCEKAQRLDFYQNGADRLTSPMRRTADGSYEPVDWDTAIAEITARPRDEETTACPRESVFGMSGMVQV